MGTPGQQHQDVGETVELWIVDAERGFVGASPPAALSTAILALAQRAASGDDVQAQDVRLASSERAGSRAVRLVARPAPGGVVAVASLPLAEPAQVDRTLSRFDLVMQATHDAVWDWNVATGETWWSRQQYEMLGYDPEATAPSYEAWQRRIHPDDRERVERHLAECVASEAVLWQCEYRFLRGEGGSVRVALDRGCLQRDEQGRLARIAGVITDITSERQATVALRASEERFRELTSAIDHFFWLTNPEGTEALYVSPAYEDLRAQL